MSAPPWRSRGNIIPGASRSQATSDHRGPAFNESNSADRQRGEDSQNHRGTRGRGQGRGRGYGRGDSSAPWRPAERRPEQRSEKAFATQSGRDRGSIPTPSERPSRLKPARLDPLQEVGLPSKGDESLLSYTTQESYFRQIASRYESFYGPVPPPGSSPPVTNDALVTFSQPHTPSSTDPSPSLTSTVASTAATGGTSGILLTAMRGLREGLLASGRRDAFAVDALVFIVRGAIHGPRTGGWETYVPALAQLLGRLRGAVDADGTPLLSANLQRELAIYSVLDAACRRGDYAQVVRARREWMAASTGASIGNSGSAGDRAAERDVSIVDGVLQALVGGRWTEFWRAKARADIYQRRLLEMAEERVRKHAINCLAKAYLQLPREYVTACTGADVDVLRARKEVEWEVEADSVVIKRVGKR